MHAPPPAEPPRSRELERRLRARAQRTRVLRRRVGALTVTLLLAFWGAVYAAGPFGSARSTATSSAGLVESGTGSSSSSSTASGDSTSTTATAASASSTDAAANASSPTAVTTQQS